MMINRLEIRVCVYNPVEYYIHS